MGCFTKRSRFPRAASRLLRFRLGRPHAKASILPRQGWQPRAPRTARTLASSFRKPGTIPVPEDSPRATTDHYRQKRSASWAWVAAAHRQTESRHGSHVLREGRLSRQPWRSSSSVRAGIRWPGKPSRSAFAVMGSSTRNLKSRRLAMRSCCLSRALWRYRVADPFTAVFTVGAAGRYATLHIERVYDTGCPSMKRSPARVYGSRRMTTLPATGAWGALLLVVAI